ncbi:MAG: hypothetical protein Q4F55_05235 [Bacillota bacterium]|nr:hypothetical protein [Bacillota bacterium]
MVKVVKGGLDEGNPNRYKFISGAVSDTRLMGVTAMHLVFEDQILPQQPLFHLFFYFDYEELGLETLRTLHSSDDKEIERGVRECFAGLGAQLVTIDEAEGYYYAKWMVDETKRKKQPLPSNIKEIQFILNQVCSAAIHEGEANSPATFEFTEKQLEMLNVKLCVLIKSDYGIVNYYLMRLFGKDNEGARLLVDRAADESKFDVIAPETHCTFLKNSISISESIGEHKIYRCESLVEVEAIAKHHYIVSEIEVYKRKVVGAKKISETEISLYEATLLLTREEYVSVYELDDDASWGDFSKSFADFSLGMTHTEHAGGRMFMDFMPNNNHAENKVFKLNDDIRALFYITGQGQLVVSAYTLNGIIQAEARLMLSDLGGMISATNHYQFPASIIYDFAESGFTDFNQYLRELE